MQDAGHHEEVYEDEDDEETILRKALEMSTN